MLKRLLAVCCVLVLLSGCKGKPTGPAKLVFDREMCALCDMVVSDRQFAAQVRGGEKMRPYKFDDFGCAVEYMKQHGWLDNPKTELWVTAFGSTEGNITWLDGKKAHYVAGYTTPMDDNFAAFAEPQENSVDYQTFLKEVFARRAERKKGKGAKHAMEHHKKGKSAPEQQGEGTP